MNENILPRGETSRNAFAAIRIGLASPEMIRAWSKGEVKKPETINYRSFKPEKDGLFCERIFGPTKDWECNCGKYRKIKHKDVKCDRCGVDVIQSKVRRERLGHIELAAPAAHIWFLKGVPSRIAYLLDMSVRDLERIIYYESYVVINAGKAPLEERQLLSEDKYRELSREYPGMFRAKMGAEAVREILRATDLSERAKELRAKVKATSSKQKQRDLNKRLKVVNSFSNSKNKPEWMILDILPVIPPEIRPLVPLDGGRFATSDLNDLYRRVINRNNRLRRLLDIKAPDVIIRNEKRMLQEAVDALFDNGRRGYTVKGAGNRPLKSLSDMLRGKQGRFRQNLLGKRVDYSGRSVIVVGPELKLWQCGLPKKMALELFKPFIIKKLEDRGYVHSIKSAKKIVERVRPEVWDILAEVIRDHPVLLNRAPTLHRMGIQAFQPLLVEGKAIRVHPLVCTAFNADFDGDQMAVHVPLSAEAQLEARLLMLSTNNILSTANGEPIVAPTQDIVLGCYYLTKLREAGSGEATVRVFSDEVEALRAYDEAIVSLHDWVKVRVDGKVISTTIGRIIFNQVVPVKLRFINKEMRKVELRELISDCYNRIGRSATVKMLDELKDLGFYWSTRGGITVSLEAMKVPRDKTEQIDKAKGAIVKIESEYRNGVITNNERYNKIIDLWTGVADEVAEKMFAEMKVDRNGFNPIYMMAESGARGSRMQIRQLAGMRGLMAKPLQKITGGVGEIIESPITSNFREGLSVLEYFISTHGARKGLADTALKTADAGYLTRRLVDVAQDVIVTIEDCGTLNGIRMQALKEGFEVIEPLRERIVGRIALDNVVGLLSDETIVKSGDEIDEKKARLIEENQEAVRVRSVLTCEASWGVCSRCYGRDLATGKQVRVGEAVGIIAAQSIGEPGTQLTLRTFHIGGTASRVVELSKVIAKRNGFVRLNNVNRSLVNREKQLVILNRNAEITTYDEDGRATDHYPVPYGAVVRIRDNQKVSKGEVIAVWDLHNQLIYAPGKGKVKYKDVKEGMTMRESADDESGQRLKVITEYFSPSGEKGDMQPRIIVQDGAKERASINIPTGAQLLMSEGQEVAAGDVMAKIPRELSKTRDITGGLPRISELFEAREPSNAAVISEIDGIVSVGEISKGHRLVYVRNEDGTEKEYKILQGVHLSVQDGDYINAADQFTEGPINPKDILKVKGETAVQEYLVNKVQEIYRLQGVPINDKHIEIIVRQMLRKLNIEDAGDSDLLPDTIIDREKFRRTNEELIKKKKRPVTATTILQGITRASLSTDSFISAASFQETTRVLTEAAVSGMSDKLRGLKENVIMGHLIPAGTGFSTMRELKEKLGAENPVSAQSEGGVGAEG